MIAKSKLTEAQRVLLLDCANGVARGIYGSECRTAEVLDRLGLIRYENGMQSTAVSKQIWIRITDAGRAALRGES